MPFYKILILAIVQGLAELLPISSSAHVVVAARAMNMAPMGSPEMSLLLVMLHTGTMFSVIVYFWKQWMRAYFSSGDAFKRFVVRAVWATVLTGVIGWPLQKVIVRVLFHGAPSAEIEDLFDRLDLIALAMFMAGLLILWAGINERKPEAEMTIDYERSAARSGGNVTFGQAGLMGAIQGICLPFRGFSRSGSTISVGLLAGSTREKAEGFSFAMAVIITPLVIARESLRVLHAAHAGLLNLHDSVTSAGMGMVFSFIAGLAALKWLSSWLESGKWYLFGVYCLCASVAIWYLHQTGF
ncbi:MAG: undecaprenyl-diphosphate phosphatase [Acidobacteriota bacterium]